ncbi:MAG: Tn3 family transposase [Sinimarinibacterium sp.]
MPQIQDRYLGWSQLPKELPDLDLEFFRLTDADIEDISRRTKKLRVPAALQLGFMRMTGSRLNHIKTIPRELLEFLGAQLGIKAPSIAALKTLYGNTKTLYRHQAWAMERIGLRTYAEKEERQLLAYLKEACQGTSSVDRLDGYARRWLFDRKLLIPADSTIRDISVRAMKDTEYWIYSEIRKQVSEEKSKEWFKLLMSPCARSDYSTLHWLQRPPGRKNKKKDSFKDMTEKIEYLSSIGVDALDLSTIPQERMEEYYLQLQNYKPSHLKAMRDPARTLHIVCFLRVTLGRAIDVVIQQAAKATSEVYSLGLRKVFGEQPKTIKEYRTVIRKFVELIDGQDLNSDEIQNCLRDLAKSWTALGSTTRAAEVRAHISAGIPRVRATLRQLVELNIDSKPDDRLQKNLESLSTFYAKGQTELPKRRFDVAKPWDTLVNGEQDRKKAMHAFEYSMLADLRRKFRAGVCWIDTSADHRNPDEMLISPVLWKRTRKAHYERLQLPEDPEKYLENMLRAATEGVAKVAEMVEAGEITISSDGFRYPDDLAKPKLMGQSKICMREINKHIPRVQLPDLLLAVDSKIGVSAKLLGRPARDAEELKACWAGVLALGTDLQATELSMMIPGISEQRITEMMRTLSLGRSLAKANELVLSHYHKIPLVAQMGDGSTVGADSFSLTSSRHLWNAQVDYRRKTASIGMYDHVADNRGYVANQPHILGNRQVGAAIHGVVSQTEIDIERLAVDTHGYSDVGMGFAKALGFDLCPRIRNMRERRLCMPRGFEVPKGLESVVDCGLSLECIRSEWDDFVRVVASISNATCSAVTVLERFGSAAQGNSTYKAAKHLGRLQRTIFLCRYLTNAEFRAEIRRLLTQVEHSHNLKRAIYSGQMAHDRGREVEQLISISMALTLLANIAQYWNAGVLQEANAKVRQSGMDIPDDVLKSISPCRYGHINLRGVLEFDTRRYKHLMSAPEFRIRSD